MSEQIEQLNPLVETLPPNVEVMEAFTSPAFLSHRMEWLKEQVDPAGDGALGHVSRLFLQSGRNRDAGMDAFFERGDYKSDRRLSEKAGELVAMAYRIFGKDVVQEFRRCTSAIEALPKNRVEFWGDEAKEVFGQMVNSSPTMEDGIDREHIAPPALAAKSEKQGYISYLAKKKFIPSSELNYNTKEGANDITIKVGEAELYQIPTSNVVNASSLDSWMGRGHKGDGDKSYTKSDDVAVTGRSIDVIMDYAERETPLPPVNDVVGYVQPDGKVLFSAINDNHRTAAAIARGHESINVAGTVTFRMLAKNLI